MIPLLVASLFTSPRVQIGAFREAPRAEIVRADLEAAGFAAAVDRSGGLARVRLADFSSETSAIATRDKVAAYLLARYGRGEITRPWLVREAARDVSTTAAPASRETASVLPPSSASVERILSAARDEVGAPYRYGGRADAMHGGLRAFDCSGFTSWCFERGGVTIPRTAADQFGAATPVQLDALAPGDLVFFETYRPGPSHVGIYLGDGRFIHASSGAGRVVVTSMDERYYAGRYLGARRVLSPSAFARDSIDLRGLVP